MVSRTSGVLAARVRNGVSGKLLPLHLPTTVPDELEGGKYLLTFAMWSSGAFTAQPENSPEQLGWKEPGSCSSQAASCALCFDLFPAYNSVFAKEEGTSLARVTQGEGP